ncbi:MAG: MotA/TolQ/ExbB proton channel family protein, partial [Planctomycetota bacterium]
MNGSISSMLVNVLAAAPPAEGADVASAVQVNSVWDFVVKGGVMMIPIGICSLVALAVVAERVISLRRPSIIPPSFLPGLKDALRKHPGDRSHALKLCERDGSPIANVMAAGIKRLGAPLEVVEKHIQEAGERQVLKLRRFVRVLSVIAAITPLLGLLGTIFGMINAFQTVAMSGEALGKAELLAEGIYEAMITTAAGLSIAIPVLVCYHWISAKIEKLVMDID